MSGVDLALPLTLRFKSDVGEHLFLSRHSRLYDLPPGAGEPSSALLEALSGPHAGEDPLDEISQPNPQSLSLNVSNACNLACGYCYAGRGAFEGRQPRGMTFEVARAAVDQLLKGAEPTAPITIGFMGGEPFVNRRLIHQVVAYAQAAAGGLDVRHSVTTNATLLTPEDLDLLRSVPFAVTVSLDGGQEVHDAQRPTARGEGSWERAVQAVRPLLMRPGQARVAARVTVTRDRLDLRAHFANLAAVGFTEIGFSPLRSAPDGAGAMTEDDWPLYLDEISALASEELGRLKAGAPLRLTNLAVALKQIHRGASSPYPCGAGGGYFSVAADGAWYACHRAIGEDAFRLGDNTGLDEARRLAFLRDRHVDGQTDCTGCWARYLCSGGCHHERDSRTGASCDFIRGWLQFCLKAYCELGPSNPGGPHE
ncbi:MAG: radical SAM protein [Phenylobacterium sp.]